MERPLFRLWSGCVADPITRQKLQKGNTSSINALAPSELSVRMVTKRLALQLLSNIYMNVFNLVGVTRNRGRVYTWSTVEELATHSRMEGELYQGHGVGGNPLFRFILKRWN